MTIVWKEPFLGEYETDADLIRKAVNGDAGSFVALCDQHRRRLWRILASLVNSSDVEDLMQETVVRAFNSLRSYRGEAPFGAWLSKIAVNIGHDHKKSAWRRRVLLWDKPLEPAPSTNEAPSEMLDRREMQSQVREAVAALPEKQRVPIWLHYFEGFPVSEIAKLEAIPESTVRSRVQAGLKKLSCSLADLPEVYVSEPSLQASNPKG